MAVRGEVMLAEFGNVEQEVRERNVAEVQADFDIRSARFDDDVDGLFVGGKLTGFDAGIFDRSEERGIFKLDSGHDHLIGPVDHRRCGGGWWRGDRVEVGSKDHSVGFDAILQPGEFGTVTECLQDRRIGEIQADPGVWVAARFEENRNALLHRGNAKGVKVAAFDAEVFERLLDGRILKLNFGQDDRVELLLQGGLTGSAGRSDVDGCECDDGRKNVDVSFHGGEREPTLCISCVQWKRIFRT
jgi:hypothetical protein